MRFTPGAPKVNKTLEYTLYMLYNIILCFLSIGYYSLWETVMNKNIFRTSLLMTLLSASLIGCNSQNTPSPDLTIDNTSPISSLVKETKCDEDDIELYYFNYFDTSYNSEEYGINFIRETPKDDMYYTVWKNTTFNYPQLIVMTIKLQDYKYCFWDSYRISKALTLEDFSFVEVGKTSFEDITLVDPCWRYYHSGFSTHHLINGATLRIDYDLDNIATKIEIVEESFINDEDAKGLAELLK